MAAKYYDEGCSGSSGIVPATRTCTALAGGQPLKLKMTNASPRAWPWVAMLGSGVLLAFLLKIVLALSTLGSNDSITWGQFAAAIQARGGLEVYYTVRRFNHPPFMLHVLRSLAWLTDVTSLPFPFWLRFPAIVADFGSVVLVWRLLAARLAQHATPAAVVALS
jgi:hypothetical protein